MKVPEVARQKIKDNMLVWLENFGCPDSYRDGTAQHMAEDVVHIIEDNASAEKWNANNQ